MISYIIVAGVLSIATGAPTLELQRPHAFVDSSIVESTNGSLAIKPHSITKNYDSPAAVEPEYPWEL